MPTIKAILSVTLIGLSAGGSVLCPPALGAEPAAGIPACLREANYGTGGSCAHATQVTLLRWQGRHDTADSYRAAHAGGVATLAELAHALDGASIRYALTLRQADVSFLQWSIATRRGCGIGIAAGVNTTIGAFPTWNLDQSGRGSPRHMVALIHLDARQACIIDPNATQPRWLDRQSLLRDWIESGSWAITPVYSPAPPVPVYSGDP